MFFTDRPRHATNRGMQTIMKCLLATIMVTIAQASAATSPLEQAAYDASKACAAIHTEPLDKCGFVAGKGLQFTTARRAVGRMYEERLRAFNKCDPRSSIDSCTINTDWYIEQGVARWVLEQRAKSSD